MSPTEPTGLPDGVHYGGTSRAALVKDDVFCVWRRNDKPGSEYRSCLVKGVFIELDAKTLGAIAARFGVEFEKRPHMMNPARRIAALRATFTTETES